jgi:predicted DNA binding CopG/RHH family protein
MKSIKKTSKKIQQDEDPLDQDLSDLIQYGKWQRVQFELKPKNKTITIRISEELLEAVKKRAAKEGLDYQKYIRLTLEQIVLKAG